MPAKDQERTGPHRFPRDYPTVAVVRTKLHLTMAFAVVFASVGAVTLLQSALDEHLMQAYIAGVACLIAAVVCVGVSVTLDGQITTTSVMARQLADLDSRFRQAEDRMSAQITGIERKENRVLHEMSGLAVVLGDELGERRRS